MRKLGFAGAPETGTIFCRTGTEPPEWWRVSECVAGAGDLYILLARIGGRQQQMLVSLTELNDPGQFALMKAPASSSSRPASRWVESA